MHQIDRQHRHIAHNMTHLMPEWQLRRESTPLIKIYYWAHDHLSPAKVLSDSSFAPTMREHLCNE
jgi:hypothetical protein